MTKWLLKYSLVLAGLLLLAGCNEPAEKVVGGDEDEHGCKSSAGYSWCAKTNQCERPWELAEREKFDNTPQAFDDFCASKPE